MTSDQRVNDCQKRGALLFKTHFDLSRYDFRLPRYHRAKKRVIFNRLLSPSLSLTRTSRSHLASPTYPKLQASDRRDSWKNVVLHFQEKYLGYQVASPFINFRATLTAYGHFESSYLGNRSRYRDKSKSIFNGTVSSISRLNFHGKIFMLSLKIFKRNIPSSIRAMDLPDCK